MIPGVISLSPHFPLLFSPQDRLRSFRSFSPLDLRTSDDVYPNALFTVVHDWTLVLASWVWSLTTACGCFLVVALKSFFFYETHCF